MLAQYITAKAQKKMMQHTAKLRSPRTAEVDDRMAGPHLSENQQDQPDHEQDQERLQPSERIGEPIPFPALAEHDFPAAHGQHQQRQADVVEIEWLAAEFASLLLEILGVIDDGIRADQCRTAQSGR